MPSTNRTLTTLRLASLSLGLVGLVGCEVEPEFADAELRSLSREDQRDHEALAGCSLERQIVRLTTPQNSCSISNTWTGTKLFGANASGPLAQFCVETWTGQGAVTQTQVDQAFQNVGGVADYDPDCGVLNSQSRDPLEDVLGQTLDDMFRVGLGAVDISTISTTMTRSPVTVAVVDTSPASAPADPTSLSSPHGEAMVDIIESLACSGSCPVTIQRVLGLPRVEGGEPDTTHGGYYGTFSDVALGIHTAANIGSNNRRIINLSLGAEPQLFGDETTSAGAAAIKTAIEYASCKGALIIAAAGNDAGHATIHELATEGPLLPAMWEQTSAPGPGRCSDFGVYVPVGGSYRPLVHSVGGVRFDDEAMPGTRSDGLPRLVAPSSHVNVGLGSPTLTGTSVSTAAVSGAAALLWSYFPNKSPTEIMDAIYAGAYDFAVPADYALGGNPTMRRLDVCRAFKGLVEIDGIPAGEVVCAPKSAGVAASLETQLHDLVTDLAAILAADPDVTLTSLLPVWSQQGNQRFTNGASYGPIDQLDHWSTYTEPQPTQPACPNCTIKTGTKMLSAALDSAYEGEAIADVYVDVFDGTNSTIYKLGVLSSLEDLSVVTEVNLGWLPAQVRSAKIAITFVGASKPQINDLIVQ